MKKNFDFQIKIFSQKGHISLDFERNVSTSSPALTLIIHHNVSAECCACAEASEFFKTEEDPVSEIIRSLRLISSPECLVQQGMMNVLCQVTL